MKSTSLHINKKQVLDWLKEVKDPEIPVLDVVEMGIVREVEIKENSITVKITPTYSGCPAMQAIENSIISLLHEKGIKKFSVKKDFSASWTTDWMSDEARKKLKDYGIAPPKYRADQQIDQPISERSIECPYCESTNTSLQSEFGSTACKAQFYCHNCEQAFEHFKCH